jgi:hypothetical protein
MSSKRVANRTSLKALAALAVAVLVCSASAAPRVTDDISAAFEPTGYIASPLHVALKPFASQISGMHNGDAKASKQAVEQWVSMFYSLSAADKQSVLADLDGGDVRAFYRTVQGGMAKKLAAASGANQAAGGIANDSQKLAPSDNEYIFVPTDPCRVSDTRSWPTWGTMGAQRVRHSWVWANGAGFNYNSQGGTGISGSGNCSATNFPNALIPPVSVLATVTVVLPTAAGNLRAWNGSNTIPLASMLSFAAGQNTANTTIIPINRGVAKITGPAIDTTGALDIAIWNESGGAADIIVDVVGYFVKPQTYAMTCSNVFATFTQTATGTGFVSVSAPACPTGTSRTGLLCGQSGTASNMNSNGYNGGSACEWSLSQPTRIYTAYNICCTLP